MLDQPSEIKKTVQSWIISLGISVFCCAMFFALMSVSVNKLMDMLDRIDTRLAAIEARPVTLPVPPPAPVSSVPEPAAPVPAVQVPSTGTQPESVPSAAPAPEAVAPVLPSVPENAAPVNPDVNTGVPNKQ